jgi:lysophospholipase L1-like esterase
VLPFFHGVQHKLAILALTLAAGNASPTLAPAAERVFPAICEERVQDDWEWHVQYRADNAHLRAKAVRPIIVFLGDSITEGWPQKLPSFFTPGRIGRGISGETTRHMLVRFRADVIDLHPRIVQIMAGTNDIAQSAGPMTPDETRANILSMVELAQLHGIRVILASVPPADHFAWRPGLETASKIAAMNSWLRDFAQRSGSVYADYWSVLHDGPALRATFTSDGVHPIEAGYRAMTPVAEQAIRKALTAKKSSTAPAP